MNARIGVAFMAVLLAVYIALVAQRAWLLLGSGEPIGIAMGVAFGLLNGGIVAKGRIPAFIVSLGTMFIAHGLLKYVVFTPAGTVKFFESLGLPGPLAYLTIAAEVLGGIALVVGYRTRVVASALVPVMWAEIQSLRKRLAAAGIA